MRDENRKTYAATNEHLDEVILEIIDEVKIKDPTCEGVIKVLEKYRHVGEKHEILEMYIT